MQQHRRTDARNGSIDEQLSKMMAGVLRHHADRKRLEKNHNQIGAFNLEAMLRLRRFAHQGYTAEDVRRLIDQQRSAGIFRFELNHNETYIRALQGHSKNVQIDDRTMFRTVDVAEFEPGGKVCIHGTTLQNWWNIRMKGLQSMGRHHVHFTTDANTIKDWHTVWIYINVIQAVRDGHVSFLEGAPGVLLTRATVEAQHFGDVYLRGEGKKWYKWHDDSVSWREASPSGEGSSWIVWDHDDWRLWQQPWESDDWWPSSADCSCHASQSWSRDSSWSWNSLSPRSWASPTADSSRDASCYDYEWESWVNGSR